MDDEKKKYELGRGVTVMMLLAAMTVGEFFLGLLAYYWWAPLLAVAVLKAFLILRDYMHIGRVLAGEEAEEHA